MGERLVVRRQFRGQNAEADSRDLAGESVRVRNLIPGPGGGDLQTPPGVVRLGRGSMAGEDQNAGSGTWGRCSLHVKRSALFPEVDLLGVGTQSGASLYERLMRRLMPWRSALKIASPGSEEAGYTELTLAGSKVYRDGGWGDTLAVEVATMDEAAPTVVDATEAGAGLDETPETDRDGEWRGLVRVGAFVGADGSEADPTVATLGPAATVTSAKLRGTVVVDPFDLTREWPLLVLSERTGLELGWPDSTVVSEGATAQILEGWRASSYDAAKPAGTAYKTPVKAGNFDITLTFPAGWYHTSAGDVLLAAEYVRSWTAPAFDSGEPEGQFTYYYYLSGSTLTEISSTALAALSAGAQAAVRRACVARAVATLTKFLTSYGWWWNPYPWPWTPYLQPYPFTENPAVPKDEVFWDGATLRFKSGASPDDDLDPDTVVATLQIVDQAATNVEMWPNVENQPGDVLPNESVGTMQVECRKLVSTANDWNTAEVCWDERETGVAWSEGGAGGDEVVATASDTVTLPAGVGSTLAGAEVEFDVTADVQDYLTNGSIGEVLQWRLAAIRPTNGAALGRLRLTGLELEVAYTWVDTIEPVDPGAGVGAETRLGEGYQAGVPWAEQHGPAGMPWIASGSGIVLWGHSGARPQCIDGTTVRPAGLKAIPVALTLAEGTGTTLAAGTWAYRVTRYDSARERDGDSVTETQIVLATAKSVILSDGFVADTGETYDGYRVWRGDVTNGSPFYLVATISAATAEAGGYTYEDTLVLPQVTTLQTARYSIPAYANCVYHKGRFVGLGLEPWKVPGSTVLVAHGSDVVEVGAGGVVFESWLDQRSIQIERSDGFWMTYLIAYTYVEGGVRKIRLGAAYDDASTAGETHWQVTGEEMRLFWGPRAWGDAEAVLLNGMTWIDVAQGRGQRLMSAAPLGDRLFVYLDGSVWVVTGGDWQDTEGDELPLNDLNSYVFNSEVGLAGRLALTLDARGFHWFFDGANIRVNDGTDLNDTTKGRLGELLRRCDASKLGEAALVYKPDTNQVWLVGLYEDGASVPSLGAIYDIASDSVSILDAFTASAGAVIAAGRAWTALGLEEGRIGLLEDRLGLIGDAVGAGIVSAGTATGLRDEAARWETGELEDARLSVAVVDGETWQDTAVSGSGGNDLAVLSWPGWTPEAGNEYFLHGGGPVVIGAGPADVGRGWGWTWRHEVTPEQGSRVAVDWLRLDLTVEGRVSDRASVGVKIYSSGGQRQEPTLKWTGVVVVAGGADLGRLEHDKIWLPTYWGRVVWVELYGTGLDQRVRLRGVEMGVRDE